MKRFHKVLATAFGAGYSPIAPGTAGAIVACIVYICLKSGLCCDYIMQDLHFFTLCILVTGAGIYSSRILEEEWGKDPSKIVIDEWAGQWIALLFIPFSWKYLLMALVLFRFFDIVKPLFIKQMEKLPNGIGVMMDDVLAGLYANVILHLMIYLGF